MTIAITEEEKKQIDSDIENILYVMGDNKAEIEQMSLDCVSLLSCTEVNLNTLKDQGFFKRVWSKLSGKTGRLERENTKSLIMMQKFSLRFITILQQQQLLTANAIISLKNNLNSLSVKEAETQQLISMLADAATDRFRQLEKRVDDCEANINLTNWLLTLEERKLSDLYPTPHIRMLEVVNEFYNCKNNNWNIRDLYAMKKALRVVGLDPDKNYSIRNFIQSLVSEIIKGTNFKIYENELSRNLPPSLESPSHFIVDEISSPLFSTMHSIKEQYIDRLDTVKVLQNDMCISPEEALVRIFIRKIQRLNINLDYECPLFEFGIEILGAISLVKNLIDGGGSHVAKTVFHSFNELKKYCSDPQNPLDKVMLGRDITSLRSLFADSKRTNEQFNGISDWDMSHITDMSYLFYNAKNFNQPIGNWDVSNVTDMSCMFYGNGKFNQSLDKWDVSNVNDMSYMFAYAESFKQSLDNWNPSKNCNKDNMFKMINL